MNDRDMGLDFGGLSEDLAAESYPLSKDELLSKHGDREVGTESGSKTLREIIGPLGQDEFADADAVHQAVLNMVGESAEGRVGYSDRGGSSRDSEAESGQNSF